MPEKLQNKTTHPFPSLTEAPVKHPQQYHIEPNPIWCPFLSLPWICFASCEEAGRVLPGYTRSICTLEEFLSQPKRQDKKPYGTEKSLGGVKSQQSQPVLFLPQVK